MRPLTHRRLHHAHCVQLMGDPVFSQRLLSCCSLPVVLPVKEVVCNVSVPAAMAYIKSRTCRWY